MLIGGASLNPSRAFYCTLLLIFSIQWLVCKTAVRVRPLAHWDHLSIPFSRTQSPVNMMCNLTVVGICIDQNSKSQQFFKKSTIRINNLTGINSLFLLVVCCCLRSAQTQSWCHGLFKAILRFNTIISIKTSGNSQRRNTQGLFYPAPLSHLCHPVSINITGHEIAHTHTRASYAPTTHWTLRSLLSPSLMSSFEILL